MAVTGGRAAWPRLPGPDCTCREPLGQHRPPEVHADGFETPSRPPDNTVEPSVESCYISGVKPAQEDSKTPSVATGKPQEGKNGGKGSGPAPPARKPGSPKEVPPFLWKLVGYSRGIPLTLLKCAERSDAEAHLQRYQEEGYYGDLTIHPIDAKIQLPKNVSLWPKGSATSKASAAKKTSQRLAKAKSAKTAQTVVKVKVTVKTQDKVKAGSKTRAPSKVKAAAKSKAAAKPKPAAKAKAATKAKAAPKAKAKAVRKAKPTGSAKIGKPGAGKKTAKKATKKAATRTGKAKRKAGKKRAAKRSS